MKKKKKKKTRRRKKEEKEKKKRRKMAHTVSGAVTGLVTGTKEENIHIIEPEKKEGQMDQ